MGNRHRKPALYVYVIRVFPQGPCKIGVTRSPHARLASAQCNNHRLLELVSVCIPRNATPLSVEAQLHKIFNARLVRGEWFDVTAREIDAELSKFGLIDKGLRWFRAEYRCGADPQEALADAARCHPRSRDE